MTIQGDTTDSMRALLPPNRRRFAAHAALLGTLLAIAVAGSWSCGNQRSGGPRYRIVERIQPPGGFSVDSLPPAATPIVWNFDSADEFTLDREASKDIEGRPPWLLRRDIENPRIVDGCLEFDAGKDSQLILHTDLSVFKYGRLEVRMQVEAGKYGHLFWMGLDRQLTLARSNRFGLKHHQTPVTYTVDLGDLTDSDHHLTRIRLDPSDSPGPVRIDSIRLLPPSPERLIANGEHGRVLLGNTYRDGRVLVDDFTWTGEVDWPDDALVRFTFGAPPHSRVKFRLAADRGAGKEDHEIFRIRKGTGEWYQRTVRAKKLGDRFTFTAVMPASSDSAVIAAIEVLERVPEPAPPPEGEPSKARETGRNVVMIVVDTLRADRLSCYGYERKISPQMDKLAAEGIRFDRATSQCTWTLPSVASLLTGAYPAELPVHWGGNLGLPASATTLAEMLQGASYTTGCVFANGILDADWDYDRGFDLFTLGDSNELTADLVTQLGIEWLETHRDESFFLYLHYVDPHDGYEPPSEDNPLFGPDDRAFPAQRITELQREIRPLEGPDELEAIRKAYDGEVYFTDREIGKFLRYLDRSGLRDDTIVLITADHGEEFLEHGGWRHGTSLYDETARVPLIMRLPDGRGAGTVVSKPVELIDLAPTILEFAEIPAPTRLQGDSLLAAIDSTRPATAADGVSFSRTVANGPLRASIHDGVWKFVRFDKHIEHNNPTEPIYRQIMRDHPAQALYRIDEDPGELRNLVEDHPDRAATLAARLETHIADTEAKAPEQAAGMDENTRRRLEELGYVQPDGDDQP